MKAKQAILPIVLLLISVVAGQMDRWYNSPKAISPFPFYNHPTSLGWYTNYLGSLCSFSIFALCLIVVQQTLRNYFYSIKDTAHYNLFNFSNLWLRLFKVVFLTSLLDIIHFLLAARQWQIFFLIQSGGYLIATAVLIYKTYKR